MVSDEPPSRPPAAPNSRGSVPPPPRPPRGARGGMREAAPSGLGSRAAVRWGRGRRGRVGPSCLPGGSCRLGGDLRGAPVAFRACPRRALLFGRGARSWQGGGAGLRAGWGAAASDPGEPRWVSLPPPPPRPSAGAARLSLPPRPDLQGALAGGYIVTQARSEGRGRGRSGRANDGDAPPSPLPCNLSPPNSAASAPRAGLGPERALHCLNALPCPADGGRAPLYLGQGGLGRRLGRGL